MEATHALRDLAFFRLLIVLQRGIDTREKITALTAPRILLDCPREHLTT